MSNDELLIQISEMFDEKLKPINKRFDQMDARVDQLDAKIDNVREEAHSEIKHIRLLLENDVLPRLQNIESCYTDTYERYAVSTEKIDAMQTDINLLKNVVSEHSRKLQNIQ